MPPSLASEELALAALDWIAGTEIADGDGVWWSGEPSSAEPDPTPYHGTAGIDLALLEAHAHFGDPRWGELARRGAGWLAATSDTFDTARYPALYVGTAGTAFALHEAAERLGDDEAEGARSAAARGLAGVRAAYDGGRWSESYELMFGNAGIGLPARRLGDAELAEVARDEAGPDGFLVPHSDPQQIAFGLERYSYGWCHRPAGDAQVFRLLAPLADVADGAVGADGVCRTHGARGAGDANGIGAVSDAGGDSWRALADLLVADPAHRAAVDAAGARWSNVEYRATRPGLEPRPGWATGNAGLVRELLRHARITAGRDPSYAVQWPDHPATARAAAGLPGRTRDDFERGMSR